MSDDKETRKIISTIRDGAILVREGMEPIFIYPEPPFRDGSDVTILLDFFTYCQLNDKFIKEFLIYYEDFHRQEAKKQKKKAREQQKKKFTLIKKD
tara:strand:- start:3652 stop:3939 length:288 start_codon:yes stop_codon:yes gene_type:complete